MAAQRRCALQQDESVGQRPLFSNGNDSGSLEFSHTTPVLGLLYKLTPNVNVYASAARGFEAPT
ncbi:TonB-dependent receptor domain-containing protein [Janthinobacterium lividum]|uniref:TonB-dependent receptor domain-containing protein n=1 Tax=Janthinobacterium lividum TaxID=29581 RepID=UPI0033B581ED